MNQPLEQHRSGGGLTAFRRIVYGNDTGASSLPGNEKDPQENLPDLPASKADRFIPRLTPVRDDQGVITKYLLKTPGGQEVEYAPTDIEMITLRRTLGDITTDQWETLSAFDLAAQIKTHLKALGLKGKDIPSDPEELTAKAEALIQGTNRIQKAIREGKQENVIQELLDLELRVLRGGKREWSSLNPIQREIVIDMSQTLAAHLLSRMGVGSDAVNMAEVVKQVDEILQQRKFNFAGAFGGASGLTIGKFIEGILPSLIGQQNAGRGLIGGTAKTAGDIVGDAVVGAGRRTRDAIDALFTSKSKPQQGESFSQLGFPDAEEGNG